jgi:hypothetical protein
MKWHFCIINIEETALVQCDGSMCIGNGYGCGYGNADGNGNGCGNNYGIQPLDGGRSMTGIVDGYSPKAWVY